VMWIANGIERQQIQEYADLFWNKRSRTRRYA